MMLQLAIVATAYGIAISLLFRFLVNREALRRTVNRILAHVMSFRVFVDEPRLVLRGQWELLLENIRLFRLLAWPFLAAAIVFALSYSAMDRHFGNRPLPAGETVVLTLPQGAEIKPSPAFAVETPPVNVVRLNQVSWRVRVIKESPQITAPAPWLAQFLILSTATAALLETRPPGRVFPREA